MKDNSIYDNLQHLSQSVGSTSLVALSPATNQSAQSLSSLIRTTKQIDEEAWMKEAETKSARPLAHESNYWFDFLSYVHHRAQRG